MVLGYFVKAVETVLTDSAFQMPSPDASTALRTARAISDWSERSENAAALHKFVKQLMH